MTEAWYALAVGMPLVLMVSYLRGDAIGHAQMLALGLWAYCVVPVVAYATDAFQGGPGEALWSAAFERLFERRAIALAYMAALVLAFLAGRLLPTGRGATSWDRPLHPVVAGGLGVPLVAVWLYYLVQARELLFSGYAIAYRPDLMGPLASVNLVAVLVLLNLWQWKTSPKLILGYGLLLAVNSTALLSMGGRMYFVAAGVAVSLYLVNSHRGRRPVVRAGGLAALVAVIGSMALISAWRVSETINLPTLGKLLLAEPVLTTISLGTLLDCPPVEPVAVPWNFLSSIANFVPSALWPEKEALMQDLDPSGNCLSSPFGATHLGTALLLNFGLVGSLAAATLFAWALRWLQGTGSGWWLYYYLCSLLPFMLFRDGFVIFNKAFLATGVLLALALLGASLLAQRLVPRVLPAALPKLPGHA